jgi:hypothetical protein
MRIIVQRRLGLPLDEALASGEPYRRVGEPTPHTIAAVAFRILKGVFYPNLAFFQDLAQQSPHELTHVRASPGDCAAGWAQAWRKIREL